ncbi:hypothetical protein I7I53_08310 [Histoplasma capsulatum var. duboisii H88]|uniref:Uncharacterized protein n=1 Tax=Ajellomyces capsulatus (strain H88) TaxID=544711 RepID=A0A8A1LJH9_AJEC8|nr:hypothetical protein I7I53_08310 [Histoplasma capsulatum var. duboisii H88]
MTGEVGCWFSVLSSRIWTMQRVIYASRAAMHHRGQRLPHAFSLVAKIIMIRTNFIDSIRDGKDGWRFNL